MAKKKGPWPRELALASALVERMREFCASRNIRFIVIDIPVPGGRYDFRESVHEAGFGQAELVRSKALFAAYEGAPSSTVPTATATSPSSPTP